MTGVTVELHVTGQALSVNREYTDTFRAMDTDIDVAILAAEPPLAAFASVRLLFEQQEQRFSRFREDSLLNRLNRGETVRDGLFAQGCKLALEAYAFTGGLFNPMILPALEAAGYDRTFRQVTNGAPRPIPSPDPRDCIIIDGETVGLEAGKLDLGGIVKGWTVDLAVGLLHRDFPDELVNAGGDMRTGGHEPGFDGWAVGIALPGGPALAWKGTLAGALATSTTLHRRWKTQTGTLAHHLIDSRTGLPCESPFLQVSAWAEETWRAECWAKAVLIGGAPAVSAAASAGIHVLTVATDGAVQRS